MALDETKNPQCKKMVEQLAKKPLVGIDPAEESNLLALDEKKKPEDTVD